MTISEFIWGLIWFTAFAVAVAAIVFMVKSLVKDCREIWYGVQRVVRRGREWRMCRSLRKHWEKIQKRQVSSPDWLKTIAKGMMGGLLIPRGLWDGLYRPVQPSAKCDYAYGNCFTCARKIEAGLSYRSYRKLCWKCDGYLEAEKKAVDRDSVDALADWRGER